MSKQMFVQNQETDMVTEDGMGGVPVCGANMCSVVTDTAYYIDEIHYDIAGKRYIENAPHDVSPRTGLP